MTAAKHHRAGRVDFVGAGPGDPGLLTLAGRACLERAEVVIYDALVNPRLLDHCPPAAERISLGKHGAGRVVPQSEVNALLVERAAAGRRVVRLKGGDPAVFARIAEETEALDEAGIAYRIVPGVTVALAAGSYAGIPLTRRDGASAVALVTGQQSDAAPDELDYRALAQFPGTLVIYMGVTTAPRWVAQLVASGKSPDTPVAIVRYCSWPQQQVWRTTLAGLPQLLKDEQVRPPVVTLVGDVVSSAAPSSWFMQRPLFGARVLVARPRHKADELAALLEELGAEAVLQPAIEIGPPDSWDTFDRALARLDDFDWIVFSSANGVQAFFERLRSLGRDARELPRGVKFAVIGPGTAEALAEERLRADLQPVEYRAESLAAVLVAAARGQRFLLVRASRGREVLAEELTAAGCAVTQIVAYRSSDVVAADPVVAAQLAAGEIDWVAVTSSAIARSLASMFGESLKRARLASISPVTSATLRDLGFEPAAEAREYTIAGMCDALVAAHGQRGA